MEFISFAIPFAALVFLTVIVGGLMNYYMDQRGLAFNPYLTYLLLPAIVGALYFVGGFSMWTVKGIVLALILLRASVQDLSEHQADEFLWVMLLILALVNYKEVGVTSMLNVSSYRSPHSQCVSINANASSLLSPICLRELMIAVASLSSNCFLTEATVVSSKHI